MNIRYTLETGFLPPIHAASMLLLVAFILISLLLKSLLFVVMPVGTLSELLGNLGKSIWSQLHAAALAGYPAAQSEVFAAEFLLYIALSMPAQGIQYFLMSAYGMIIDVKMLDFFRHIGSATLIFVVVISVLSLFIRNARCRYLCPYGALLGLFSLLSPFKIRRNADSCIDCGKCAKTARRISRSTD